MNKPLWHGRFGEGPADELLAFRRRASRSTLGSRSTTLPARAHVQMLTHVGLLTAEEGTLVLTRPSTTRA